MLLRLNCLPPPPPPRPLPRRAGSTVSQLDHAPCGRPGGAPSLGQKDIHLSSPRLVAPRRHITSAIWRLAAGFVLSAGLGLFLPRVLCRNPVSSATALYYGIFIPASALWSRLPHWTPASRWRSSSRSGEVSGWKTDGPPWNPKDRGFWLAGFRGSDRSAVFAVVSVPQAWPDPRTLGKQVRRHPGWFTRLGHMHT